MITTSPGIYFLYDEEDTLIYIGKAMNIFLRVKQHIKEGKILFSKAFGLSIENEMEGLTIKEGMALLGWIESQYIFKYAPRLNKTNPIKSIEKADFLFKNLPLKIKTMIMLKSKFPKYEA